MKKFIFVFLFFLALPPPVAAQTPGPPVTQLPSAPGKPTVVNLSRVRACLFVPGVSVPAQIPSDLLNRPKPIPPPAKLPSPTSVDGAITTRQLGVYRGLWNAVNENYVDPNFRGRDWKGIGAKHEALIRKGLSDKDFYEAMQAMVSELGDEHSYFQSPVKVQEEKAKLASQYNFVGIGTLFVPTAEGDAAYIISLFPDGPAAQGGLKPHDVIRKVEGGPIRDPSGISRTLGPEGSKVTMTFQRPGESPHDVTLTRRRVTGSLPIDFCVVPTTRIGYIFLPTLLDKTMPDQVRGALKKMTAEGPLTGLILDNRMNGGGLGSSTESILGYFTNGSQGHFVSRKDRKPLLIKPENVGGSQTVPMVVLVGPYTVSYGEVMSGVLRLAGRAKVVGETTLGNVEQLRRYELEDGSLAWIASATFEPKGQKSGVWEETGIIPDVIIPTRWDLFTEANDPALAKAVELLTKK